MLIDIHTHLDQHDRAELPEILDRADSAGVGAVVIAGTTVESSEDCIGLANADSRVFAGVGVHPTDIDRVLTESDLEKLDRMASSDQVVVMSEVGLDYLPTSPDHELQKSNLRAQLDIARRHRLPVVFHVRESAADAVQLLADEHAGEFGGAAHYFQGDRSYARQVLDLGFHVSLAKPLLRLPELQDVAKWLPMDRIVLETDSYPQPFKKKRSKWTEPRDLPMVAAMVAKLKGVDVDEVENITTANALAMCGERAAVVKESLSEARSPVNYAAAG